MYLIELKTKKDADDFKMELFRVGWTGRDLHVGLLRDLTNSEFYWISDGSPVQEYSNWSGGEPNNVNNLENCVVAFNEYSNYRWLDGPCDRRWRKFDVVCYQPQKLKKCVVVENY